MSNYQAYKEYINDTRENTIWDLDDIESSVPDDELGSTVFTRAINYMPVSEALESTTEHVPYTGGAINDYATPFTNTPTRRRRTKHKVRSTDHVINTIARY